MGLRRGFVAAGGSSRRIPSRAANAAMTSRVSTARSEQLKARPEITSSEAVSKIQTAAATSWPWTSVAKRGFRQGFVAKQFEREIQPLGSLQRMRDPVDAGGPQTAEANPVDGGKRACVGFQGEFQGSVVRIRHWTGVVVDPGTRRRLLAEHRSAGHQHQPGDTRLNRLLHQLDATVEVRPPESGQVVALAAAIPSRNVLVGAVNDGVRVLDQIGKRRRVGHAAHDPLDIRRQSPPIRRRPDESPDGNTLLR